MIWNWLELQLLLIVAGQGDGQAWRPCRLAIDRMESMGIGFDCRGLIIPIGTVLLAIGKDDYWQCVFDEHVREIVADNKVCWIGQHTRWLSDRECRLEVNSAKGFDYGNRMFS